MTPAPFPLETSARFAAPSLSSPRTPKRRSSRHLRQLSRAPILGRLVAVNYFQRSVDKLARTAKYPRLRAFLSADLWPWLWHYLRYVFTPRFPFQTYEYASKNGVYRIKPAPGRNEVKIAIAGDWGTGTNEAHTIATLMARENTDFTIHLGDVYYVGDEAEIDENFFGEPRDGYDGVAWPAGRQGTFALNGNHEMYANGEPYFTRLLKRVGLRGDREGQVASFFCLETGSWRILAIDTGYNSVGLPVLGMVPGLNRIPRVGGDCTLEPALLEWIRDEVRPQERPMPTLLLSHHQYFTAFPDQKYPKPARQLAEFFQGQELVWLWGYEHRLGIYAKASTAEGLVFHGRCIGHGGMPVELAKPDPNAAPLWLYDRDRSHALDDGTVVGENGFVVVTLDGPELTLEYRDSTNQTIFAETFAPAKDGTLDYTFSDPGVLKSPA